MGTPKYHPGDTVQVAGWDFVLLDNLGPVYEGSPYFKALVLSREGFCRSKFGDSSAYKGSELEKTAHAYESKLLNMLSLQHDFPKSFLFERELNLTSVDGTKDQDPIRAIVAPLTFAEFWSYREHIPPISEAVWLASAWGSTKEGYSTINSPLLGLTQRACNSKTPVIFRPAFVVSSAVFDWKLKEKPPHPDLSKVPITELLDELRRRQNGPFPFLF